MKEELTVFGLSSCYPVLKEQKDTQVLNMSSKWALADHLEYCSDDKLSELDNYEENMEAGQVSNTHASL